MLNTTSSSAGRRSRPLTVRTTGFVAALAIALTLAATGATSAAVLPTSTSSLFGDAQPETTEAQDDASVELGMRFIPEVDGEITAIRFYAAGAAADGYRTTLWNSGGRKLATASSSGPSDAGWQEASLAKPVPVDAGEEYVVSYLAPHGRYAADEHFFDRSFNSSLLSAPAGAGVYAYGSGGFPTQNYLNTNYYVDVEFSALTPELPLRDGPAPAPAGALDLPVEPWWGGPSYYSRFPKAAAAGWDEASSFPIAVFFGKPAHATALAAIGINTFMGAEHDGSKMSTVTDAGIFVVAQSEWTPAEIGDDPRVVGWHVSDECEMGYSDCTPDPARDNGEQGRLAVQQNKSNQLRSLGDGRFLQANFGNGVLGTYWAPNTMDDHVSLMDVTSVDKYAYTSPHVQGLLPTSAQWPEGKAPASAGAYGWLQDRMETFSTPIGSRPNWVFVETAEPFLTEPGATVITGKQIQGAVWNALIHGAAGIAYFQHNSSGTCGTYSLVECSAARREAVATVNAEITALAPVLNTPSYEWRFGDGLETALKTHDGDAYILAMTDGGAGSRTFTLPPGVVGTIEVVGEDREIEPTDGRFVDDFSAEYEHHVYRVNLID